MFPSVTSRSLPLSFHVRNCQKSETVSGCLVRNLVDGDVNLVKSARGNTLLAYGGKLFTLNRKIHETCYWECLKKRSKISKCGVRVISKNSFIKSIRGLGIWMEANYNFIPNRRGGLNLIHNGYLYTAERKYNSTTNWVCNKNSNVNLKCPARCVTAGSNSLKLGASVEVGVQNYSNEISESSYACQQLCFIRGQRGKNLLVFEGFTFAQNNSIGNTTYWCCRYRKTGQPTCKARVITLKAFNVLAVYAPTSRGKMQLIYGGQPFIFEKILILAGGTEKKYWRCNQWWNQRCRSRVYTINDVVVPLNKYHTHEEIICRKKRTQKRLPRKNCLEKL